MGFRLDALMDGISPKTMPTTMENTTETTMDRELIATGTDAILEISCASPIPMPTPMMPPMLVSTDASVRNCARIFPFFAPIAFFRPISRVRSVTDTSMMFITPNIVMLTGDSQKAAEVTAEKLGITQCFAQVLPEDKHRYVEQLKADGHRVIMVGDGINDAPALAAANVSVAMSDASDIAREAADITLRGTDLTELATLRTLSEKLMARIHRNYRFIIAFNSSLLLLGLFGVIAPTTSAFLHNASTMAICAKSMTPVLKKPSDNKENETEEETA